MKQDKAAYNPYWEATNTQSGLRIPLGKEDHQIALAFASEQANVKQGKQVFLNTLSVIAVHECLKMFGFDSPLTSGDCWDKAKRATSSVADLFIPIWEEKIECFPILPDQTIINLDSPDLLENRKGCIGVKFHEHLNYVEMLGFKYFDEKVKSDLTKTLTLEVNVFEPFEDIFNYITPIVIPMLDVLKKRISQTQLEQEGLFTEQDYKTDSELSNIPIPITRDAQKTRLFKKIEIEENDCLYKILVAITVSFESATKRTIKIQLKSLKSTQIFPPSLQLKCIDTHQKSISVNLPPQNNATKTFREQQANQVFQLEIISANQSFSNHLLL